MEKKDHAISKKQYDKLADKLKKGKLTKEEENHALEIITKWRSRHFYPMNVFKNRLEKSSQKIDSKSITSQRLKRVPSILQKLSRLSTRLTQIQDIAGCRTIMSSINKVEELTEKYYLQGDLKHPLIKINDYIKNPKPNGYRGIHLIYKFKSDKEGKKQFNDLFIEVQIRSRLQHIWATTVEITDFFTKQSLKSDEGSKEWIEFFKLVSNAFAKKEQSTLIPNTPKSDIELISKIKQIEKKLNIINKMQSWTKSIRSIENKTSKNKNNKQLFLLKLDLNLRTLEIKEYSKRNEEKAIKEYLSYEKDIYDNKSYDVVLVGSENIKKLKKTYPNYFLDTKAFIKQLKKIIN